ncbi:hypothetical protein ADUPG1_014292 [Aduncisulcus paluster]|uniref:Exoribonuclease phosphorolytic domain-containing protein n=1 Tax=Aduncisulcus paluster TaxID=2918883 RepID=A0ABQ5KBX2_9EUKA|nr:hypothetical protein ADUPG1_014292 [Aduncisulcus paluster]
MRKDGRDWNEIRPISMEFSSTTSIDGICKYQNGDTIVQVYIKGPFQVLSSEKFEIRLSLYICPFADISRRSHSLKSQIDATYLQTALESIILRDRLLKSRIEINIQVLQCGGSVLPACFNGCVCAMCGCGIPLKAIYSAVSIGAIEVDKKLAEEQEELEKKTTKKDEEQDTGILITDKHSIDAKKVHIALLFPSLPACFNGCVCAMCGCGIPLKAIYSAVSIGAIEVDKKLAEEQEELEKKTTKKDEEQDTGILITDKHSIDAKKVHIAVDLARDEEKKTIPNIIVISSQQGYERGEISSMRIEHGFPRQYLQHALRIGSEQCSGICERMRHELFVSTKGKEEDQKPSKKVKTIPKEAPKEH